jgi:molybdate transport system regulatory protein
MDKPAGEGTPRLWLKIALDGAEGGQGQIGPGKIALLNHIRQECSISAAARAMGMSYRRAWLLVEELNTLFGRPVVKTYVGGRSFGGAELTELGQQVINCFSEIERRASEAARQELETLASKISSAAQGTGQGGRRF